MPDFPAMQLSDGSNPDVDDDTDADDDQMDKTPSDVVAVLGFDPANDKSSD